MMVDHCSKMISLFCGYHFQVLLSDNHSHLVGPFSARPFRASRSHQFQFQKGFQPAPASAKKRPEKGGKQEISLPEFVDLSHFLGLDHFAAYNNLDVFWPIHSGSEIFTHSV